VRTAALAAAALVLAAGAAGCRSTSGAGPIDAHELERRLAYVVGLELVHGNFFDRTVDVACVGAGDDLHFKCHVDAKNPTEPTQSWDEQVACTPDEVPDEPRCFTSSGDALL
jgi:hypothetical protein